MFLNSSYLGASGKLCFVVMTFFSVEVVLTSTHNLYFEQKYEKYQNCLSENFHFFFFFFFFFVVKFSEYLNRHVFVMSMKTIGT